MKLSYYSPQSLTSQMFRDLWNENYFSGQEQQSFDPATDIVESEGHYSVAVDLPGLKKENIKIETHENVLTISGERRFEKSTDKKQNYHRSERSYGFFKKSFTLPNTVQPDKIEAHFADGVLSLHIPKAAASQKRTIEIGGAKTTEKLN